MIIVCIFLRMRVTQVMTLCTYIYFAFSLISQQFVVVSSNVSKQEVDLYVPIAPILQFLFYMGWLKVSSLIGQLYCFKTGINEVRISYASLL